MSVVVSRREVGVCRQEFEIEVPASEVDAEYLRVARDLPSPRAHRRLPQGEGAARPWCGSGSRVRSARTSRNVWRRSTGNGRAKRTACTPCCRPAWRRYWPRRASRCALTVTVDVEPEVEIGDSRSFELPQPETEPSEAEVEELLEQVRLQRSTWVPVDRAAARGDRVRGRIHRSALPGYVPEAAAEDDPDRDQDERGPATHDIDLELGDERAWPELTDNLTGLSAGQKADFERTETDEDVERQRSYEIEVEEVLERKLPDVDDDWASSLAATIETVDDLRRQLGEQVQAQKTEQAGQQRTDALLDQLRERYPVTLPEAVVEREASPDGQVLREQPGSPGLRPRTAAVALGAVDGGDPAAGGEKRAHSSFLLDRIARDDGVEATAEDLERALEIMARARNTNRGRLRRELERDGGLEMLRVELRRDRTVQTLLAANAPPEEPSAPADEPAAEGED